MRFRADLDAADPWSSASRAWFKKRAFFFIIEMQPYELGQNPNAGRILGGRTGKSMACCPQRGLSARQRFGAHGSGGHLYSGVIGRVQWFARRFGWGKFFVCPFGFWLRGWWCPCCGNGISSFAADCSVLYAHYNVTWCNERAVEVPLGRWYLEQAAPQASRVLKVDHVLGRYGNHDHAVLDKYETAAGVISEDLTAWQTRRFDLIRHFHL